MLTFNRKPLRTYGRKRAHPSSEPSNYHTPITTEKRRRVSSEDPESSTPSELPPLPPRASAPASSNNFEKGSILHYFKPSRASSSLSSSSNLFSDPRKLASTPPSSPPQSGNVRRSPRRLRLRPPEPAKLFVSEGGRDKVEDRAYLQFAEPNHARTSESREREAAVDVATQEGLRRWRQDPPNTRNDDAESLAAGDALKKGTTGGKSKRSKSSPIQTTINLSTKPAFEECKMCHIVYNPLHPKDVRYHTKRHKAILRNKSLS
ncbi:hypothetical protein SODALDRAFT_5242 [Sodiomyces alkalinus F11]|uniref:N-acetyltransferase ESCO zinc-finger domain-containing protein n=1 Tax=Sodiomyces alkalinus (strain CBS 110278 / VKM F-3762 / F11) TaxID=1314773 RepID=A0A3N2Q5W5_SODAK|nr:hypothetical protein SODALDRAFT_5242 [Sodiomyces alkalinus F11]ROT42015.1 hypothetical protein SODALDRAFT_5242 [Sodiomyces alkalinus F11]